jgi:Holliday junction resolvasome RuvABC endonuclease subunit
MPQAITSFLGIDPGAAGGAAIISSRQIEIWGFERLTEQEIWFSLWGAIRTVTNQGNSVFAMIERLSAWPGLTSPTAFKLGRSYGFLRGCLIASGVPFGEVHPRSWQKTMECLTKGDKKISRARAQQLFPKMKITHATADALLIAEFARRSHGVKPSKRSSNEKVKEKT